MNLNITSGTDNNTIFHIAIDDHVAKEFDPADDQGHIPCNLMHLLDVDLTVLSLYLAVSLCKIFITNALHSFTAQGLQFLRRFCRNFHATHRIAVCARFGMMIDSDLLSAVHVMESTHARIINRAVFPNLRHTIFFRRKKIFIPAVLAFLDFLSLCHQNFSLVNLLLDHRRQVGVVISLHHTVTLQISDQLVFPVNLTVVRRSKIKPRSHTVLFHPKPRAPCQVRAARIPAEILLFDFRRNFFSFVPPYHSALKLIHLFPGKFYLTHVLTSPSLTLFIIREAPAVRRFPDA